VGFLRNQKGKSLYLKFLQWAIVIAIFFFLGRMFCENWIQVKEAHFAFRPLPLLLSTLIFAFSYFVQIWAWYLITLKLGIAISPSETLGSWFYSQLGKYLPGKVWLLLGRYYFYESKGKSKKAISIALYLETITVVMAAGLMFLAALAIFKQVRPFYPGETFWWFLIPFTLAFVAIHPRVLQTIFNWVLTKFNREPIALSISYFEILWILWVNIMAWIVGGIGFYFFAGSVFPVSSIYILFLTGALAFSSTLGLIALFAPSGLGVREGALVYLLSFIMPISVAVIISVLTRIWMTLIEIGLIGVVYLLSKIRKRLEQRNQDVQA
jgi:uncharacterized membrane protein YbhN (UPF0104 family)